MYNEQRFDLSSTDNTVIPCIYASSNEHVSKKVIILLHGISSHKDEYLDFYKVLSENFVQQGYATLRFDFRGHGESTKSPSDFTIASQIIDLSAAIKFIEKEKQISTIDLVGCSFGAPPCIFASSLFKKKINNIYLIAPILDYNKTFINPNTDWGKETFYDLIERAISQNEKIYITDEFYIGGNIVSEISIIDIEQIIKNVDKKIKIMHGNRDGMVDYNISEEISQRNSNIELHTFDNMEHGFTDYGDEDGTSAATKNNIDRMVSIITGA